ncbi:(2Fe-2S)-binding protein [candidate division KSB1 bacterium]|nr:(2Fe-2S)-binding protein [candidate division KSB1 bacterium]
MITLTINDSEVSVEPGTTIISAAEKAGIVIPHYCWHPALSIAGSCRLCLVEIEGAPKDVIACGTPVTEGMVVRTESEKVKRDREIILEFLLLNHPLDCPVCDKAGNANYRIIPLSTVRVAAGSKRKNGCRHSKISVRI